MVNYKVLESSQRRIYTAMRFDAKFLRSVATDEFNDQVAKDVGRSNLLVEPGQNISDLRSQVYQTRNSPGYFSQSDYEGGSFLTAFYKGSKCSDKLRADTGYIQKESFGYVDRDDKVCGLTIYRFKEDPPKYAISFVRNADAAILEDRETTIIYAEDLPDILGVAPFDTSSPAQYPDNATDEELAAAGKNELTQREVLARNLQSLLISMLNSDTAAQIVEGLFISDAALNPDAIQHIPEIIFLYKFLDIAAIPSEAPEELIKSFGRDISIRRVNIQDKARANPIQFFAKHNFKSNLIDIMHIAAEEQKPKLALEYIKYCAIDHGLLDDPLLQELDGKDSFTKVILEKLQDGSARSARDTNRYYLLYLDCLAMESTHRSERKRIFRKIEQIADNLGEDNTEVSAVVSVKDDLDEALVIARTSDTELNFDPQGRLLIDTGQSIVSLDIAGYPDLQEAYSQQIKKLLQERDGIDEGIADAILDSLNELKSKNSIIFLQQEMHFHLMLALRLYEKQYAPDNEFPDFTDIHAVTMAQVNKAVMQAFVDGLVQASATGKQRDINKVLSKARSSIIAHAHDALLDNILQKHPDYDLSGYQPSVTKSAAKHTTATGKKVLHQDKNLAVVTEIEGSDVTSHYRARGTDFAHRGIKRYRYTPESGVTYCLSGNKVRSPSLPVKKGLSEQGYIDDTVEKINELVKNYGFKRPFTYNLLTAMNDVLGDIKGNLQTQSAKHIILGAHAYNRDLLGKPDDESYCLIQAISVNGFGRPLGYRSFGASVRPLADEATLLTEMTLCHNIDKDVDSLAKYKEFLRSPESPVGFFARLASFFATKYFCKTTAGKGLRGDIAQKKLAWQAVQEVDPDDYVALARASLQKIMAHDLHYSHDYAKLIQALSLFLEEEAVFGCKSGNERTPIIDERGQILEQRQLPGYLVKAFVDLSKASNKQAASSQAHALKAAIDRCYNEENVYGSTALIPLIDQGAGHKISPAKSLSISRNDAEEPTIDNLVQSNAKEMQAHNELPIFMEQAVARRNKLNSSLQSVGDGSAKTGLSSYGVVTSTAGGLSKFKEVQGRRYSNVTKDDSTEISTESEEELVTDNSIGHHAEEELPHDDQHRINPRQ